MITRRGLLAGSAALAAYGALSRPARAASGQTWGAIRWDALWAPDPSAARQAQGNLWINRWQFRAPSWASVVTPNQLAFTPGQAQMDGEIAAGAGKIAYWMYNYYPPSDPLTEFMNGLAFHRTSAIRTQMKYCLMVNLAHWGGTSGYSAINAGIATMLAADTSFILKASGARPVVYLLWDNTAFATTYGSSNATVKVSLDDLRAQIIAAGLANPYVILLFLFAGSTMTAIGADALSAYGNFPFPATALEPYTTYSTQVQAQWVTTKNQAVPMIPTVMMGWDPRPRIEQPVSFNPLKPWFSEDVHVVPGTNAEIAALAQAGVDFINNFPVACPEKIGLIYSWDECDEGGGILPTIGDPTGSLLNAIGAVVA